MSTGGIFQLITNDGKQDRMLMASELLRNRLRGIENSRKSNPSVADPTPTLLDIERTHILFTNAHFKPFVAVGFEYNKTKPNSGVANWGSEVIFSIPQFGDFFHDMVVYVQLKQPVMTVTASNDSDKPLMRWCPYPGERIFSKVEFEVNGNPIDSYYDYNMNFHREFSLAPSKRLGWERCLGQEEPEEGYFDQPNWANSGVSPNDVQHRVKMVSYSGDQTPTGQKDTNVYKELLVPLLFWCNTDVRLAVPSVAIPYGQRYVKVTFCDGKELVNLVPRGAGDWTDSGIGGSLTYDNMFRDCQLYINNIFVNPEIHSIFIRRIGFNLIRVHRHQTISCDKSSDSILLQQLKWPIETLYVAMKMKDYDSSTSQLCRQHLDKWHKFTKVEDTARSLQGWRSGKLSLKNSALSLPQSVLNCVTEPVVTKNLRLTMDAAGSLGGTPFDGINAGDILVLPLTTANTGDLTVDTKALSVTQDVTLTLEVAQVVPDLSGTLKSYIQFKQLVQDVKSLPGISGLAGNNLGLDTVVAKLYRVDSAEASGTIPKAVNTLDTIKIQAHGITIYQDNISNFYNAYLPYHFGGPNLQCPQDKGALFVPFNLYPGTYQPSGHLNISRAREFYISYTSSVISNTQQGNLIVAAKAINFLLISDGSAVLRYST